MRIRAALVAAVILAVAAPSFAAPIGQEQEILDQFLKKTQKTHAVDKLGWLSLNLAVDRINRNNDYNSFANHVNQSLSGDKFSWLNQAYAFNGEFGMVFSGKFAWSVGGEYWLKTGDQLSGTVLYAPPDGSPVELTNPKSEIKVAGVNAGLHYFVYNPPRVHQELQGPSVKIGGNVGFYQVNWDLFPQSQNLNLSTSTPDGTNATFKGNGPGFSFAMGVNYPIGFYGLQLSGEASYLYLNFTNVAWYNEADQEVVASYNDASDGRVDLNLSGVRARIGLTRFFSW